jgi:capsid protein
MIAPKEETAADVAAIRGGLKSLSEAMRERGYDPVALLEEMKADAELISALGLVLDSDPRATTQQGQAQKPTTKPADQGAT